MVELQLRIYCNNHRCTEIQYESNKYVTQYAHLLQSWLKFSTRTPVVVISRKRLCTIYRSFHFFRVAVVNFTIIVLDIHPHSIAGKMQPIFIEKLCS